MLAMTRPDRSRQITFLLAVPAAYYSASPAYYSTVRKVKPVRKLLVLVFIVALVASACSGSGKAVATVNGLPVTLGDVEDLAPPSDTMDTATFGNNLRNLIVEQVVLQAAQQEWNLSFDTATIDDQYNQLVSSIDGDVDQYLSDKGITPGTLRHVAIQQLLGKAIDDRLSAQLGPISDADLQTAYEGAKQAQANVCAHHILVATEEEANAVIDRINAGESFEDIAAELSIDTNSGPQGGDLGCGAPSKYVPTFAQAILDAPVGELYGPVQTEYGFHVIRVDSREVPAFEDVKSQLEEQVKSQQGATLFKDWITSKLDAATIEVDSKYGTWSGAPDYAISPSA
ncbi:putative parvulin-type peptidyl-prolyl cis-trans isomerase precursor [bacterium BMS3Abin02]|nr:putative parvulin-type peptidyl-prolyl cis-trans isomerase precursor [bacterium BMS3Abin02]GBE22806.1 putative parvulin-type peptidyl-prolyl cis-trans isomerase precursor [bacterium BMS3Bbin01]HDL49414.1 hypothetical protein [Actinomycetota bacterium]